VDNLSVQPRFHGLPRGVYGWTLKEGGALRWEGEVLIATAYSREKMRGYWRRPGPLPTGEEGKVTLGHRKELAEKQWDWELGVGP